MYPPNRKAEGILAPYADGHLRSGSVHSAERDKIDWKLITNLPVHSRKDAMEKLTGYAMRWRIETFS